MDDQRHKGLTLIELLVAIAVLAILISQAGPALAHLLDNARLLAAAHRLTADLQLARSEALQRGIDVSLIFRDDADPWCYGFTITQACDCAPATGHSDCTLETADGARIRVTDAATFPRIQLAAVNFSNDLRVTFNAARGTAGAGHVTLESGTGRRLQLVVSTLGRIRLCVPDDSLATGGYPPC